MLCPQAKSEEVDLSAIYSERLQRLRAQPELLAQIQHGIEKESLRVDPRGRLSQKPHPQPLGSTLTHPYITTDYSEALMEFITPVYPRLEDAFDFLTELHCFTQQHLDNERLWAGSMPCQLEGDSRIPIAYYGDSNIGRMKYVYREGLWHRYGKAMQTIAGIHYNFSLPPSFWNLHDCTASDGYFGLIRNFRRHSWLLMYLFGASPALSRCFLAGQRHELLSLHDDSLYLPYATSLRMSDLGYTNSAQSSLSICYNRLDEYVDSLRAAIRTPYPAYEKIGLTHDDHWLQLSTNLLQIENEYYSPIRPKRVIKSGEKPVDALAERGVEYIEVRCLDINPFLPLGLDLTCARFIDLFLTWCALRESPLHEAGECGEAEANFNATVTEGRRPGLQLHRLGQPVTLTAWGEAIIDELQPLAELFDQQQPGTPFQDCLREQQAKLDKPDLCPSAQVLDALERREYLDLMQELASRHAAYFQATGLEPKRSGYFEELAQESRDKQTYLEAQPQPPFADFIAAYFAH